MINKERKHTMRVNKERKTKTGNIEQVDKSKE